MNVCKRKIKLRVFFSKGILQLKVKSCVLPNVGNFKNFITHVLILTTYRKKHKCQLFIGPKLALEMHSLFINEAQISRS
jgi:hypothetical protein